MSQGLRRLEELEPKENPLMAEGISDLTDATFDEEVGASENPVLVDSGRSGVVRAR
jgi:hypothetical protein